MFEETRHEQASLTFQIMDAHMSYWRQQDTFDLDVWMRDIHTMELVPTLPDLNQVTGSSRFRCRHRKLRCTPRIEYRHLVDARNCAVRRTGFF